MEKQLKDLKIRHGLGDIDKETYDLTFAHLNSQFAAVAREMSVTLAPQISNLEKLISSGLKKLSKLNEIWRLGNLDVKRRIQKTLFPEGILYMLEITISNQKDEFICLSNKLYIKLLH